MLIEGKKGEREGRKGWVLVLLRWDFGPSSLSWEVKIQLKELIEHFTRHMSPPPFSPLFHLQGA